MKSSNLKKVSTISFYSLLEKYKGDIKKAKESELARVFPKGLKQFFKELRAYTAVHQ